MAEEENTKSLDDEIQGVIRTNQTLLRKKGLLKRLLEDSAIKNLLNHVLTSDKENILSGEEGELLQYLSDNEFNLDKTIEKMVEDASEKMKRELKNINDKMMEEMDASSQPDEGPSQAEDDAGISYLEKKPSKKLTQQQVAKRLGLQGEEGNRSLLLGRSEIEIVVGANYKILPEQGAQVRTEADIYSEKKKLLPVGQIVKVIESQEVVDAQVRLGAGARGRTIKRVKVEYGGGGGWISTVSREGADIIEKVRDDGNDAEAQARAQAQAAAQAAAQADADGGDQDQDEDADGGDQDEDAEAQAQAQAAAQAKEAQAAAQAEADAAQLENMQQAIASSNELAGGAE